MKTYHGVQVSSNVEAFINGTTIEIKLPKSEYYNEGKDSPLELDHLFRIASTGTKGVVIEANTKEPYNHIFKIKPINDNENLATAGNKFLLTADVLIISVK